MKVFVHKVVASQNLADFNEQREELVALGWKTEGRVNLREGTWFCEMVSEMEIKENTTAAQGRGAGFNSKHSDQDFESIPVTDDEFKTLLR